MSVSWIGWQFDTNGCLTVLPQLEEDKLSTVSKKSSAESYPVHLTGDLIWAFIPSDVHGESFPIDLLPEQYYPCLMEDMKRDAIYTTLDHPCSFDMLIENALDPSHFPFAHHGVLGSREDASPLPMKVVTSNFTQLALSCQYTRRGQFRERIYQLQRPLQISTKEKVPDGGFVTGVTFFFVPVREGRTRVITSVHKIAKPWFPQWCRDIVIVGLLEGDQILHDGERNRLDGKQKYFNPASADLGVNAFSVWWSKYGMKYAPPHSFGQASRENLVKLPKSEQSDFWSIHTSSCSHCQKALLRSKRVRVASSIFGFLGWSIFQSKRKLALAFVCASLGALGNYLSHKIIVKLEGSPHPSDRAVRGISMYK